MLNYTTTTFVNSASNIYANSTKKFFRVKYGPEIHNDGIVRKACLVGYEAYRAATKAKLDFNLATTGVATSNTIYRLVLYIRERNNNSPIFSNTWVFGGKPIIIEYTGGTTVSATLTSLMETIEKYMLNIYGNEIFTVSNPSGNILRLEAKDQWTMFMTQEGKVEAYVEKLVDATSTTPEHWETVVTINTTASSNNVINNGNEAFGDFAHIMKDLRLPTRENTSWFGTTVAAGENDDVPSVTGHYHQYTIQLTSERGVLQQSAVGGVGVSRTVHVFYVENSVKSDFETALTNAGIIVAADSTANPPVTGTVADMTIDHSTSPATVLHAMAEDSTIADDPDVAATATV